MTETREPTAGIEKSWRRPRLSRLRTSSRALVAFVAAACVAGGLLEAPPAHAAALTGENADATVETVSTTSLTFAGTAFLSTGRLAANADVSVVGWPRGFEDAEGAFELVDLGSGVTDGKGRFTVAPTIDASTLPSLPGSDGSSQMDVEVLVSGDNELAAFSTTLDVDARTGVVSTDVTVGDAGVSLREILRSYSAGSRAGVPVAVVASTTGSTIDLALQMNGAPGGTVSQAAEDPVLNPNALHSCSLSKNLGNQWTVVGAVGSTTSGYVGRITYGASASTAVTVGMSLSGKNGSFNGSGTTSRSSTATIGFPTYTNAGYRVMKTQFSYGIYKCGWGTTGSHRWVTRITGFVGGAIASGMSMPSANYCAYYTGGSKLIVDSTKARTQTAAVSGVYSVLGMNLSATTGYSSKLQARFAFNSGKKACGTNGYPGAGPGVVVVKA
ncbi:hypothetical protein [Agrococcus casei]|uniref:Uncharacterized protein n=1 Tax=Agrococcus casei LMG 22410 TaxID=1255656 RepID=A0A1R4FZ42_9MICO|nr:hypothetical protein [Agrococcus casei]SJM61189.1 hypothetical protein CZ674_07570 [Agrococcus casei LMG 22410]